jgi:hypothetical protein
MNNVRLVVFRAHGRQHPNTAFEIDLVPAYPCDLVAALPSEREDLDDRPVGSTHSAGCALSPSQGERSRIARPTHQPKNDLTTFNVLFAPTGEPRSTTAFTRSMMSRLAIAWTERKPKRWMRLRCRICINSRPDLRYLRRQLDLPEEFTAEEIKKANAWIRDLEKVKYHKVVDSSVIAVHGHKYTWGEFVAVNSMSEEQIAEIRGALEHSGDYDGTASGYFAMFRRIILERPKPNGPRYPVFPTTRLVVNGEVQTTWADFTAAKRDSIGGKFIEIYRALESNGEYHGSGDALAEFTIKLRSLV